MIEVELLKDFGSWTKGTVRAVSLQRAKYWERIGLAKRFEKPKPKKKETVETESKKETKNDKPRITSKSKGKS